MCPRPTAVRLLGVDLYFEEETMEPYALYTKDYLRHLSPDFVGQLDEQFRHRFQVENSNGALERYI